MNVAYHAFGKMQDPEIKKGRPQTGTVGKVPPVCHSGQSARTVLLSPNQNHRSQWSILPPIPGFSQGAENLFSFRVTLVTVTGCPYFPVFLGNVLLVTVLPNNNT